MLQGNSRPVGGFVDDADSLAVGDVLTTVGLRFLNSKVVELSLAAFLTFIVKGKEGVTGTLEGNELIRQGHHAS